MSAACGHGLDRPVGVDDGAGAVAVGDHDGAGSARGVELAVGVGAAGVDGGAFGSVDDAAGRARGVGGWRRGGGDAGVTVGRKPRRSSRFGLLATSARVGSRVSNFGQTLPGSVSSGRTLDCRPRARRTFSLSAMGMFGLVPGTLKVCSMNWPKPVQPGSPASKRSGIKRRIGEYAPGWRSRSAGDCAGRLCGAQAERGASASGKGAIRGGGVAEAGLEVIPSGEDGEDGSDP